MIALFEIAFKAGLREPPVMLICQSVDIDGELVLWVDGLNAQDPVVIPMSAVARSRPLASFESYIHAHKEVAKSVLLAGAGEISPTIAARAIAAMVADPRLDATQALELVNDQALDLIDADTVSQAYFWGPKGPTTVGSARSAATAA